MVDFPSAIIDLEDFTESINMVLYADSGIGKTVFGGSDHVLFLSMRLEKGTISAKRMGSKAKVWPINEWDDLNEAYDWLEANPDHGFKWIVIDSVTAMQALCMRGILDTAIMKNKARDPDIPEIQDWNKYYLMFDRFIAAFNDLPCNVLYLATSRQNEDEEGEPVVIPNLQGRRSSYSISQALCASVGIVGYLQLTADKQSKQDVRRIMFKSTPPYFAKDRYNVLPHYYTIAEGTKSVNTLKDLRELIEASGTEEKAAARTRPTAPSRRKPPARPGRAPARSGK